MNTVIEQGRLTKDPYVAYTQGNTARATFTIAVDRAGKEKSTDFIPCVAWGKTAETIGKYFKKGKPIIISGSLKSGSYERKDGTKAFTLDVWVERFEFVPVDKSEASAPSVDESAVSQDRYEEAFQETWDDIPF
jgi:single-strand DNA-binding protein